MFSVFCDTSLFVARQTYFELQALPLMADRLVLEVIDGIEVLYIENGVLVLNAVDDGGIVPGHYWYGVWMAAFVENSERDIEPFEFIYLMKMPTEHILTCSQNNVFRGARTFTRIEF